MIHCVQPHFWAFQIMAEWDLTKTRVFNASYIHFFFLTRGFISHYKRCIHALTEVMPGFPALKNPHGFMIYSFFPLMQLCLSPSSFQIVPLHKDKIKSWLIMREISLLTLQGESNFWFPKGASISEFESHHTSKGPPERQQHSPSRIFNSPWI